MTMSKFMVFAGAIAALSSLSFAWTINGIVVSDVGQPIAGVKITSPNYPSVNAATNDGGSFSITDGTDAIHNKRTTRANIQFYNNVISISGMNANTITVSVMDALGKVAYSKTMHNMRRSASFDLNKSSIKGAKYLRINADGHHDTYKLGDTVTLLKEGDPLPIFNFSKEGFRDTSYTMKAETEVVLIHMTPGVNDPVSSSTIALSSAIEPASSSATVESSSSEAVSSSSEAKVIDCSSKTLRNDTEIMVDGRKVIVKFPNGYTGDKPVPMLINYHQIFGSASDWVNDSKIGKVALADGAISIYPDGADTPNGEMGQAWNVGPCCTTADDVTFSRNFIKELTEKACVDPKRIYAAGWSMGGGMSNYAGCVLADVIAAAAPSAFDLTKEVIDAGKCNPARPFPILNFRSTNDGVVTYGGGLSQIISTMPITFLGAEPTFEKWKELDKCTGNYVEKDGCRYYENCEGGVVVGLCILNTDHNEGDPQKAWNFLKQFSIQ